jgi:glycosyltransferase involved in cell wall biosynthesis
LNTSVPSTILVYKNFAANKGISHIGLGVSAAMNARVITANIGPAQVVPCRHNIDIVAGIVDFNKTHENQLTNVVISAPWISTRDLRALANHYKHIQFTVTSHSNVGFLQADPNGIRLIREGLALSQELPNFNMAGNSQKFVDWLIEAYGTEVTLLPNMYPSTTEAKPWLGDTIRIGTFGAVRPQKNLMTAAAAAISIGRMLNKPIEFYYNSGRDEGGGGTIAYAIYQMCNNIPNFTLTRVPWRPHNEFKEVIRSMDILIQMSYTESFNMVTADGIDCGVPSVVSDAIYWAPDAWKAEFDEPLDVARVGVMLLTHMHLRKLGLHALMKYNHKALQCWTKFLTGDDVSWTRKVNDSLSEIDSIIRAWY